MSFGSCNFEDKVELIRGIVDDEKRKELIHKHISEVVITEYIQGKTKKI